MIVSCGSFIKNSLARIFSANQGPKIEKFRTGLRDWKFQARLNVSSKPSTKPLFFFMGKFEDRDWSFKRHRNFQARLKISSGLVCGRTDISRIFFVLEPPDFVADLIAGFFLLIFVGKNAQKNLPRKSPAKSSKFYTTKIPNHFLQRGRARISSKIEFFFQSLGFLVSQHS